MIYTKTKEKNQLTDIGRSAALLMIGIRFRRRNVALDGGIGVRFDSDVRRYLLGLRTGGGCRELQLLDDFDGKLGQTFVGALEFHGRFETVVLAASLVQFLGGPFQEFLL